MFKIPTYDELEKSEKELNEQSKRKEIQLDLFKKRNLINLNETREPNPISSSLSLTSSVLPDSSDKYEASYDPETDRANKEYVHGADDEDDLLNDFILKNKGIIDDKNAPASSSTSAISASSSNEAKSSRIIVINKPLNRCQAPANAQTLPPTASAQTTHSKMSSLVVNSKQKGNPMLKHITNVPWLYSDTLIPDYCMSRTSCAYYLSMKYHLLNPTYIHTCLRTLGRAYDLRVLLVMVDIKEPKHCIKELEKIAILSNLTMLLCWSNEEAAHYLETYKMYEFKSADAIMEKSTNQQLNEYNNVNSNSSCANSSNDFINNYTDFLCAIKSINKTDASTLRQTFGCVKNLSTATKEELNLCPGLGPLKINKLLDIFRTPFLLNNANKT